MRLIPRLLLILALVWLGYILFAEARGTYGKEEIDGSKIVLLFGGVVLLGGVIAIMFVTMVMPAIGDAVGNFFFSPNEQIEKDPHADAVAAVGRGDYEAAIAEFKKIFEKDPTDTFALSEIAKIYCDHLEDPAAAADVLGEALQREWTPDATAFLCSRLVDVHWKYQHDARSSRALLMQIVEVMPDTKYSANAQHRLQEIERELAAED